MKLTGAAILVSRAIKVLTGGTGSLSLSLCPFGAAMFKLSPTADTSGVTMMGEFDVPPALLFRTFGAPSPGDGFKISGEFIFVDSGGEAFVVHDWKSTNLWEPGYPSPAEFWASEEPQELSMSTRDLPVAEFECWLFERIESRA